ALEAICLKAMATVPEDRYTKATALADDVERWLADEPVSCHREPVRRRFQRWKRKHPRITTLSTAVLILLLLAGPAVFLMWNRHEENQHRLRTVETLLATAEELFDLGQLPGAQEKLAQAQLVVEGTNSRDLSARVERSLERIETEARRVEAEAR